uniref:hypothetical protein n=1 Tax=Acetatifactor sp. TaxID=1872090 RepID=UPI0040573879
MAKLVKNCDNCKHRMKDIYERPCNTCKRGKADNWEPIPKQTNFDNIKAMPTEEAAKLLAEYGFCITTTSCAHLTDETSCTECITHWLNSKAEDE